MNCSATVAISERRPDLRKARRKPVDPVRAAEKERHFAIMMVHEKTLERASRIRTENATGPLLCSISTMAEPLVVCTAVEVASGS